MVISRRSVTLTTLFLCKHPVVMNRKWHNHSVLETKTQTTKALIQHVFGVSDQETDLVRILKFRSPNRFTVLYKITSWTGDFFSVCGWRDVKIQDIDDSLFLKKKSCRGT